MKATTNSIVEGVKKEYQDKEKSLVVMIKKAEEVTKQADTIKKNLEINATKKACELIRDKEQELEKKYQALGMKFYGYLLLMTSYGVLVTVLTGARNKVIVNDFKSFFGAIWSFLCMSFQSVFNVAKWSSKLGDMIPQEVIAFIVHWLLYLLVIVISFGSVGLGIYFLIKKFIPWFKEELADLTTLTVVLVTFALVVFFGVWLKGIIPIKINLLLLTVLAIASYSFLRVYTKPK